MRLGEVRSRRAGRQRAWDASVPRRPQKVSSQHIQLIFDDVGFEVRKRCKTLGPDIWEKYLRLDWLDIVRMEFATDRYDPVVALYAWTAAGARHHVADSGLLSQSQWVQVRRLITGATHSTLKLDLAGRDNPRSMGPDW